MVHNDAQNTGIEMYLWVASGCKCLVHNMLKANHVNKTNQDFLWVLENYFWMYQNLVYLQCISLYHSLSSFFLLFV